MPNESWSCFCHLTKFATMSGFIHKRLKRFNNSADPSHWSATLAFSLQVTAWWHWRSHCKSLLGDFSDERVKGQPNQSGTTDPTDRNGITEYTYSRFCTLLPVKILLKTEFWKWQKHDCNSVVINKATVCGQKYKTSHEPNFFSSLVVKSESTRLCHEELKFNGKKERKKRERKKEKRRGLLLYE